MRRVVPLAAVLVLTGCGGDGGTSPRTGDPAADHLQVTVGRSDSTDVETWMDDPFAPLPGDVACTDHYGGPQTANVLGRWDDEPVDVVLSRTDGCRIAQWDALGPLLPGAVG